MESVKTIIITGGGGDLGQSVARWWAKPEARLVLLDRDAERLEKFRAEGAAYPQHNSATVQPTAVSGKESGISTSPEAWLPAQEEPGLTLDQNQSVADSTRVFGGVQLRRASSPADACQVCEALRAQ